MIKLTQDNRMLGYELLKPYPDIFCFVTTRHGGYGTGNYATFNCTSYTDDDAMVVKRNQEHLLEALPAGTHLIIPHQVHDIRIQQIIDGTEDLEDYDALMTKEKGFCLCISTADCVPIMLYDTKNKAIAAVHAGWRGTVKRIVMHALHLMHDVYGTDGKDVLACIGPSISLESFEVGDEVYDTFKDNDFDMSLISKKNRQTGKYHIDLWQANQLQLLSCGILKEHIQVAGLCTYIHQDMFFSARRLGISSGRILSGILLNK
jgi:YfiH family protein